MEKNGKDAGTTPEKGEEILSGRMSGRMPSMMPQKRQKVVTPTAYGNAMCRTDATFFAWFELGGVERKFRLWAHSKWKNRGTNHFPISEKFENNLIRS